MQSTRFPASIGYVSVAIRAPTQSLAGSTRRMFTRAVAHRPGSAETNGLVAKAQPGLCYGCAIPVSHNLLLGQFNRATAAASETASIFRRPKLRREDESPRPLRARLRRSVPDSRRSVLDLRRSVAPGAAGARRRRGVRIRRGEEPQPEPVRIVAFSKEEAPKRTGTE